MSEPTPDNPPEKQNDPIPGYSTLPEDYGRFFELSLKSALGTNSEPNRSPIGTIGFAYISNRESNLDLIFVVFGSRSSLEALSKLNRNHILFNYRDSTCCIRKVHSKVGAGNDRCSSS